MGEAKLIADSGGTSTKWCIVKGSERSYFTTESYHPLNWSSEFRSRIKTFWQEKLDPAQSKLTFFGAGCYDVKNREKARQMFQSIGFSEISIFSDLHAAGQVSLNNNSGWVAICGTGSVVFQWDGNDVGKVVGGKGHILGDEGSGYYFGKLVVQSYQKGELTAEQNRLVKEVYQKDDLTADSENIKYSSLAQLLNSTSNTFNSFHEQNIYAFFETHFKNLSVDEISIIGGYGWHLRELFSEIGAEHGIRVIQFINEPIKYLVEQIVPLNE